MRGRSEGQADPRRLGRHLWRPARPRRVAARARDLCRAKARGAADEGGRYLRASAAQASAHDRPAARGQGRCGSGGARAFGPDGPKPDVVGGHHLHLDVEGFLYLAHVQDLFSRLIVGWSMVRAPASELVVDALEMALARRRPDPGLVHHSDQGCQFTAVLFTTRCAKAGIEVSMGRVGDCYDNAVCETFHASLKKEKIYRQSWPTRAAARTAIFEYIEGWYNPRRRHSTLGYLSPIEFEQQHTELAQLALEASISPNGSVASIAPRASHALTTRRVPTVGVDFAARAPISPENGLVVRTGPAQAATEGGQGTNGAGGLSDT